MGRPHEHAAFPPVTIVAHDIGPVGGMERQLSELIRGLVERRIEVTVVARTCDIEPDTHLRFIRVRGPRRPFALAYLWFFIVGTLLVARHRRGVLHTTGAIVANHVDVCTVHFCHRASTLQTRDHRLLYRVNAGAVRRLKIFGERLLYRSGRCNVFVAVSPGLAQELRMAYPAISSRVAVIAQGVDAMRFRPDERAQRAVRATVGVSGSSMLVLFAGGLWEHKGLQVAISALAQVDDATLMIIGEGDVERYSTIARALGVGDRVRFLGRVADPERYFAAADVFVLPSMHETFSLVAYEAAASGLPLLATRVHGIEDILVDGENGWFIDRDPQTLANRLDSLRLDPDRRRRFGIAARNASHRFSWDRMTHGYEVLYERAGIA